MTETTDALTEETPGKKDINSELSPSEWLMTVSFGEGLRRSFLLLQRQFGWLVLIFFLGGFLLSVFVLPINMILESLFIQIMNELFAPSPDFVMLFDLFISNILWDLFMRFILAFGVFLLNALVIHRILRSERTLWSLSDFDAPQPFPITKVLVSGFIMASFILVASIIPLLVLFLDVLLFFVPALLIIDRQTVMKAFRQSINMRHRHWQRILGALIIGSLFVVFAGTFGVMIAQNIVLLLSLFGISSILVRSLLLIVFTQLFIAMVAPILPLLSVTFYSGAKHTLEMIQRQKYFRHLRRQQTPYRHLIPFSDDQSLAATCIYCNTQLKEEALFCQHCGVKVPKREESVQTISEDDSSG